MASTETLYELTTALSEATDDAERAGLHDAIAKRLSEDRHFDEALQHSLHAVELRERCAQHTPEMVGYLTVSVTNLGLHLTKLERYDEAIAAHARALELLQGMKSTEIANLARLAYNAERIGILLWERSEPGLAVRFDGLALATYLTLAAHEQRYKSNVRRQLLALSLSLGRAMTFPVQQPSADLETTILRRLGAPSLAAARCLSDWAQALYDSGDISRALATVRRTISYCSLFEHQATVATIAAENQRRIATWPQLSSADSDSHAEERQDPIDRRLWCCTGEQLSDLMRDLEAHGFASSDVHSLGHALRVSKLYLARDFAYRCQSRAPNIFITYTWSDNYVDLQVAVRSVLTYLRTLILEARPDLDFGDITQLVNNKLGIWIDFIFIDQSARNLGEEVRSLLPRVIEMADVHFVLSDTAMLRSWCCYELALFNARSSSRGTLDHGIRSFIGRSTHRRNYELFAHTSTTNPEDKTTIEGFILESFPGGMPGFDSLMIQTSMISDPFISHNFVQSLAAIAQVELSLDKWLAL